MDVFDPNRHKLHVNLSKGVLLREADQQVQLEKTNRIAPQPNIIEIKDAVSGKLNKELTPGGSVQIWGSDIRISGEHESCGLWFINAEGSEPIFL